MTLPQRIIAKADPILNHLLQTKYQYVEYIDADAGIYDCLAAVKPFAA
jgi:hypothetical protein